MVNLNNLFLRMRVLGISAKNISDNTGISTGNISDWKSGRSMPSAIKLDILANYLDCSVDYLLGRTDNTIANTNNVSVSGVNNGVVGHNNSSVTIHNNKDDNNSDFSTQEKDLLRIYNAADGKTQMKIMQFIYGIEENL